MMPSDPHGDGVVMTAGVALAEARSVLILLHGRGGSAQDILDLGMELGDASTAYLAPQAAQYTWYPNSFLAPLAQNEPWLSSAIEKVSACVGSAVAAGIKLERIALAGFSQGACLASEFVASHPGRYGALVAFTGGLIGPMGMDLHHPGRLDGLPVLLSSGDPDHHVPWERVRSTAEVLTEMGATVQAVRYANRPHTILREEIEAAKALITVALA